MKNGKNSLKTVKKVTQSTGLRCFSVGPSSTNPRKEKVTDYKTRAFTWNDKDDVIATANQMITLAMSDDFANNPDAKIVLTAHTDKANDDGIAVTVLLRED